MTERMASFRELKGIGPATEARLHQAGVHTWEALAEVVEILSRLGSGTGDALGELAGQLEDRRTAGAASPRRAGGAPEPAPPPEAAAASPPPSASAEHLVVLDAGRAIGGASRTIEIEVATNRVGDRASFEYRATLAGRPYGQAAEPWTTLGTSEGRGRPPARLPVRFEGVDLPPGLQRLRLELALRLVEPRQEPPVLTLA